MGRLGSRRRACLLPAMSRGTFGPRLRELRMGRSLVKGMAAAHGMGGLTAASSVYIIILNLRTDLPVRGSPTYHTPWKHARRSPLPGHF